MRHVLVVDDILQVELVEKQKLCLADLAHILLLELRGRDVPFVGELSGQLLQVLVACLRQLLEVLGEEALRLYPPGPGELILQVLAAGCQTHRRHVLVALLRAAHP